MCGGGGAPPQQPLYIPPEPEPKPEPKKKKLRRGRESRPTLLTGSQGVTEETTIGSPTLIGS